MVESIRRIFLGSWLFQQGEDYFSTPQSYPPCQGLVGNLLWEKGWVGTLSILGHAHLELFPRCHQGTILSRGELWGQVHRMDYAVVVKGSICAWSDEFIPYPTHKVGYQRFKETFDAKVSHLSAHIHSGGNGVPWHLLAWYDIPVCCQDWEEIQKEEAILYNTCINYKTLHHDIFFILDMNCWGRHTHTQQINYHNIIKSATNIDPW